jgi:hypothetical protein
MDFAEIGKGFTRSRFAEDISRWGDPADDLSNGSDKWARRPDCFEKIQVLAISRDLFTSTPDDCECIINFFPSLRLLVILIDNEYDIRETWNIQGDEWETYESDWED